MKILPVLTSASALLSLSAFGPSQAAQTTTIPVTVTVIDSCAIGSTDRSLRGFDVSQGRLSVQCSPGTQFTAELTRDPLGYMYVVTTDTGKQSADDAAHIYAVQSARPARRASPERTYAAALPLVRI
jgi:hypothetical protein